VAGCFIYFLTRTLLFLIYVGDKTYSSIKTTNKRFIDALYPFQPELKQYHWTESMFPILSLGDRFDEVIDFMNLHKSKK
jgi:hypothetical protein